MTFGKYKGKTLAHVMTKNAGYLIWAHREIRFFMLSKRLLVLAAHYAESQHLLDRDEQYYGEDNDWFWPLDDDVLFGGK